MFMVGGASILAASLVVYPEFTAFHLQWAEELFDTTIFWLAMQVLVKLMKKCQSDGVKGTIQDVAESFSPRKRYMNNPSGLSRVCLSLTMSLTYFKTCG